MKKFIAQLAKEEIKKWFEINKELLEDYKELCEDLLFFEMKWGINIGFVFHSPKEIKGRGLGESKMSVAEELFDVQKFANSQFKNKK